MKPIRRLAIWIMLLLPVQLLAQGRSNLPPVTTTFKGSLNLPIPLKNPLFQGYTETIGQLDGVVQFPVYNGLGFGIGGKMTWFALKERALAPELISAEIRRATFYGKVAYEKYTGARTFYELSGRAGMSLFTYDCGICPPDPYQAFNWGMTAGYYVHVSHNLAFGFLLGYERDAHRFGAANLGLERFAARRELAETRNFQNLIFGMGFSTRFTRNPDGPEW
jgi:hypothetical protein